MREIKDQRKKSFGEKIDDMIGVFSPQKAHARKAYRSATKLLAGVSYRGSGKNRLRGSWMPGGGSPDEDTLPELGALRERSRDLVRNDPHAAGIISTVTVNTIGRGIKPQSRLDTESLGISSDEAFKYQKDFEKVWKLWTVNAEASGRLDFTDLLHLVDRQILENGEIFLLPTMLKETSHQFSFTYQMVEADRVDTPRDKRADKSIRGGIKLGEYGESQEYWIRKTHPGDKTFRRGGNTEDYVMIPTKNQAGRKNVIHLYIMLRPGQTRGVPFFAPALTYFKDLADFLEAEVVAARIAACFALFVTKENAYQAALNRGQSTSSGKRLEEIEPGMIEYLEPGEKIDQFAPQRPGGSFEPFVNRILRMISASLNLPYELVSKDFSQVNYSSARAALLEARRYFQVRQDWIIRKLCDPTWQMVQEEAYLRGYLDIKDFYGKQKEWTSVRWITPGWQWVDPLKESKASRESMDAGITSLADETANQGRDWEETMEQSFREAKKKQELEKKYGVKIATTQKGKNAKIEIDQEEEEIDD